MERRKFLRFPVSLKVEAANGNRTANPGLTKDFSREGLRAVFDDFDFNIESLLELKIQRPNKEIFVPAGVEVRWRRPFEGKWEAGFRLRDFPSQIKAEILEYGYHKWLSEKLNHK